MSSNNTSRNQKRIVRHRRIRGKVKGTSECPRLSVFCSLKFIYAQVIDDEKNQVLVQSNTKELSKSDKTLTGKNIAVAEKIGEEIALKCAKKQIEKVVFDRGGYKYHGRIKALAESARKNGLKF